jgi:hypothetical protein
LFPPKSNFHRFIHNLVEKKNLFSSHLSFFFFISQYPVENRSANFIISRLISKTNFPSTINYSFNISSLGSLYLISIYYSCSNSMNLFLGLIKYSHCIIIRNTVMYRQKDIYFVLWFYISSFLFLVLLSFIFYTTIIIN